MPQTLLPIFPAEATPITDLLSVVRREQTVSYFHGCLPVFTHQHDDYASFWMIACQWIENGNCKQVDIVRNFGVSAINVKRKVKKFRQYGAQGLLAKRRGRRKPRVWSEQKLLRAQQMFDEGKTRDEVSATLSVKKDTLYRAIGEGKLEGEKTARPAKASGE